MRCCKRSHLRNCLVSTFASTPDLYRLQLCRVMSATVIRSPADFCKITNDAPPHTPKNVTHTEITNKYISFVYCWIIDCLIYHGASPKWWISRTDDFDFCLYQRKKDKQSANLTNTSSAPVIWQTLNYWKYAAIVFNLCWSKHPLMPNISAII